MPFLNAHLTVKQLLGVSSHKFPTNSGLHSASQQGVHVYVCMKQLVARAEAEPATRAVVGPAIGTVAGVVTGAVTQHHKQKEHSGQMVKQSEPPDCL